MTRVPFDNLRRGIDYGFDAEELARIKDDFPGAEVCWNLDTEYMELWHQGDSGRWLRFIDDLIPSQFYKVHDRLREMRANANRYRNQFADVERAGLEKMHKADVDEMVNEIDPDRIGTQALNMGGRVKPVSMATVN